MKSSTNIDPKPLRDIAYYQQRYRNRVFAKVVSFVSEQATKHQLTQKDIATKIRKDPAVLSRILGSPSNLTLDTISDVLLAFEAEAEPPEIVLFEDRRPANYMHPLMAKALDDPVSKGAASTQSTSKGEKSLRTQDGGLRIEFNATSGTA